MSQPPPLPRKSSGGSKKVIFIVLGAFIVFVILGVAALAVVAPMAVREIISKAHEAQTRAVMKDARFALNNFRIEYNDWPEDSLLEHSESTPVKLRGSLLMQLLGENRRGIKFLDGTLAPPGKAGLVMLEEGGQKLAELRDSWGNSLYLMVDVDLDNRVPNPKTFAGAVLDPQSRDPSPEFIPMPFVMFSSGPDGDANTWKDNIASWMK